jgi:hypothetical protein
MEASVTFSLSLGGWEWDGNEDLQDFALKDPQDLPLMLVSIVTNDNGFAK